jgi:undecaprenyl diphosphate synthase
LTRPTLVVHHPSQVLLSEVASPMPRHVAVVMDGNGRWATRQGLPRMMGHQKGVEAVRRTVQACIDLHIPYLTLYAFSTENWRRSHEEVQGLMLLLRRTLKSEIKAFKENNICLRVIGRKDRLPKDLMALVEDAQVQTKGNTALTLVIALDYGGRDELVRAAQTLATKVQEGLLNPQDITEPLLESYLDTAGIPDPDLMIRPSDVLRMSNFLTWQTVYSELVFPSVYWPDFKKEDLVEAIAQYQKRERRFGRDSAA